MKRFLSLLSFLSLFVAASFATALSGEYRIGGAGASYATLSAACADLRANGLSGDVTFLICADINEVSNIGITNTSEYTLTIRPDAAVKRTIDFGTIADNAGPSGHVVIGYDLAGWAATETQNVVIDGAFEGDGQYLEFRGGTKGGVVVVYYGHVTESVVKNCRLISPRTSGTTYVAHFRTEQLAGGTAPAASNKTDNAPEGVGFENCYMQVTGVGNAQAVYYNGSLSKTSAGKPKQCYIRGCEILSNLRGVFYNGAIDPIFENNIVRIYGYNNEVLSHGINGLAVSGTVIVRGNKFEHLETYNSTEGDYGMQGITASGGATAWIIENNYFAGMTASYNTIAGKAIKLIYVRCGDSCVVRHNSFYMPTLAKTPSTELMSKYPITCLYLAGSKKYPVENNIFVSTETSANNSLIRGGLNANVKNNVFYHAGGKCAINAASTTTTTWEDFTAGGANARSKWKLPTFVNAAAGNLDIATADKDLKMPRLSGVLNDITGASRANLTNAGAYEKASPLAGEYNIRGVQADYTSLFAATADINQLGISADVTLLICDNLTEQVNPVLTNGTEHSITIRPDADADRKISFTAVKDNYGPSGAFIIGGVRERINGVDTIAWNTRLTNNIIINGYAEGGTTRRLTFDTPQGFGANAGPIVFYGDVHNSKIINCIVNNSRNGGTTGITLRTADMSKFPEGTPDKRPENILIENNIIAPRVNGQGIVIRGTEASVKGTGAPIGTIIRNNRIIAENRGVFLNGINGLLFENNELIMNGAAGFNAHGVFGNAQVIGDIIVRNNKIKITTLQTADADNGIVAVGSSGSILGREEEVHWYIDNNYFYGMDALAAPAGNFKLIYIRAADNTTIRHNTFFIPTFTNTVPMGLVAAKCASAVYLAGSHTYSAQNNIFVCEETNSKVSLIRGALNTNIRNNIFYHAGGNGAIVAGGTIYNTYNDLPEAYKTTYNNKNIHVEFSDTYKFTDEYANNFNLGVERIEGLNYDIEGNVRNYPTRAGCYDPAWCLTLDQTATDNTDLLTGADGIMVDAVIKRSFGNDGWYTLVLPFDATVEQLTEVFGEGYKVAVLKDSRWKSETDIYLNFAPQATIEAGVPCLIKPATSTGSEIVFHNVTIDKDLQSIETDVVDMIGLYNQTTVTLDADNYYLGNGNILYEYNTEYASSYALTNGFRAYFHFNFPLPAGCSARVIFREDTATEIEDLQEATTPVVKKVLRDEQLIIIRDGKEYNVQGQLVR